MPQAENPINSQSGQQISFFKLFAVRADAKEFGLTTKCVMSLYSRTEDEKWRASLRTFSPRLVIPAHAGIQVCLRSLSLDTRFRGYDGNAVVYFGSPGSSFYSSSRHGIFEGEHGASKLILFKPFVSFAPFVVKYFLLSLRLRRRGSLSKLPLPAIENGRERKGAWNEVSDHQAQ
jgi:hypothetical protein